MAIDVEEVVGRREFGPNWRRRIYKTAGDTDESNVKAVVLAYVPATVDGIPMLEIENAIETSTGRYEVQVRWGLSSRTGGPSLTPQGGKTTRFRTGGNSAVITEAIAQTAYGSDPPDVGESINVTADGVEGVEIVLPAFEFVMEVVKLNADVTPTYIGYCRDLTGKTNDASITLDGITFGANTLLLTDVTGEQRNDNDWTITFTFKYQPALEDATVGAITGIDKAPHDYLWTFYGSAPESNRMIQVPVAVYVAQVYEDADFTVLGIHDGP